MRIRWHVLLAAVLGVMSAASAGVCQDPLVVTLPQGVRAVWDMSKADHETTPTRERICINGLWRWQPAVQKSDEPPGDHWGYFKVPACWPGITAFMQKASQTSFANQS